MVLESLDCVRPSVLLSLTMISDISPYSIELSLLLVRMVFSREFTEISSREDRSCARVSFHVSEALMDLSVRMLASLVPSGFAE